MKTKQYLFTESEILTLREATIEYYHILKTVEPKGPLGKQNKQNAKALKEQFKQDASTI